MASIANNVSFEVRRKPDVRLPSERNALIRDDANFAG
jgi:hypothetical protein